MEQFSIYNTQLVIIGDLNIHFEDPSSSSTTLFQSTLEQFGLAQHVSTSTHKDGGWLDAVITRDDCTPTVTVYPPAFSDHGLVIASVPFLHETPIYAIRQIRGWRNLDRQAFLSSLLAVPAFSDPGSLTGQSTADLFNIYERSMADIIDHLLPLHPARQRSHPLSPWFDGECHNLRRQSRRLERIYQRTRLPADRIAWISFVRSIHRRYREKEGEYWEHKISSSAGDSRKLWTTFKDLLGRPRSTNSTTLPPFTATEYANYYESKIRSIRRDTESSPAPVFSSTDCRLETLTEVSEADLRRLILSSPPKSSELDPVPSFLIQESIDVLLPFLTLLCNTSLREGVLPSSQKRSVISPIIKQPGLDPAVPSSYRPIANVTFISKIIEKLVASQLFNYLDANHLLPQCQSGFRKGHSTESLLLRLLSDIYCAIDRSQLTLLALFDVSAAFDSVDHDILLRRLSLTFGIKALPLEWLTSYLTDRSSSTIFHSTRSPWRPTPFGLPQGSVLGPLLYILFTADIESLLATCSLLSHSYADDIQSYTHCSASHAAATVRSMLHAIDALNNWMSSNRLLLNPLKTKYIWFGTRQQLDKLDLHSLASEFPNLLFSTSVRDLGIILDQELSFTEHFKSLTRSCYYQLRQLRVVARSLSSTSASALVHAFIANRLDYCSSLYFGLPQVRLNCIYRVMRAAARLVGRIPRFGHVSDYMRDVLHWLPPQQRIFFRISSLVWHCVLGTAPSYLQVLLTLTSSCLGRSSLRSASRGDFMVPHARTAIMQHRAFSVVGPSVWNGLPSDLRSLPRDLSSAFYRHLKTYLFDRAWIGSASE